MKKIIQIILESISKGSGFSKTRDDAKALADQMGDVQAGVKKLGMAFGTLGGIAGNAIANIIKGGIWGTMAELARMAISLWKDHKKAVEEAEKKEVAATEKLIAKQKEYTAALAERIAASNAAAEKANKWRDEELDKTQKLIKAEIELKRQRAIAAGMSSADADKWATSQLARVDKRAADEAMGNRLLDAEAKAAQTAAAHEQAIQNQSAAAAQKRALKDELAKMAKKVYDEKYSSLTAPLTSVATLGGPGMAPTVTQERDKRAARSEAAAAVRAFKEENEVYKAKAEALKNAEAALKEAQKLTEKTEAEKTAAEHALEMTEKDANIYLVKEKSDKIKAKNEEVAATKKEEIKAAQDVAAERAKLDQQESARRERERQAELTAKIKDHQTLLAAEKAESAKAQSAVSAADSKLQQAWGWYRNKDSMAAQMAEEKADAEARKQFEKDFSKLKSRRRDWRTAENLSVDEEAVRRVAVAREEKQAAEKHLEEIEKNTADLAAKLDELLQVKG